MGIPHPKWGERPLLVVVPQPQHAPGMSTCAQPANCSHLTCHLCTTCTGYGSCMIVAHTATGCVGCVCVSYCVPSVKLPLKGAKIGLTCCAPLYCSGCNTGDAALGRELLKYMEAHPSVARFAVCCGNANVSETMQSCSSSTGIQHS